MKIFAFSDCHGFADELIAALDEAGFEKGNPDHLLVGCGDYFDRGKQPREIMLFLESIPNKVLIKGNHEQMLVEAIEREYPHYYDFTNGTFDTICALGDAGKWDTFDECCLRIEWRIDQWVRQMVNYYETENYIFVHSFVPIYTENWRESNQRVWDMAMWGNPYELAKRGFLPDKTLVFGHWHCSTGWAQAERRPEFGEDSKFDIFHGDGFISIDACTAYTGKVNILVLEDDLCKH